MFLDDQLPLLALLFSSKIWHNVSTADMQNTKRQKVSTMSSSGSDSIKNVPSKSNELCSPALAEDKTMTTPPDSMNADSYLLCNKVRVHTSIPTMVLPHGSVVLPISDNKWTIVSLESD
ncbi:hypothetical protein L6452_32634 [Arctium lappa]|uniref:Uncharacterized protein n=1 Tax=Arctium lappa TaxID=4217 RepID=A0ACB8Z527_ARCLA|nr:hypothetical protein L6452_32634 [Arctium lappa]